MLIIAILTLLLVVTPNNQKNYNYLADYIKFNRIVFIIFILAAYLAYNVLNIDAIGEGVGIFGGVFKLSILSQVIDIILCLIGAIVVILTCFAPYHFRVYDDTKVMNNFMNSESDKKLKPSAVLFKNSFKDYYNYKLINNYSYNDYNNKYSLYVMYINILKKISSFIPNIKIKSPFLLENKLWYSKLEVKEFSFLLLYTIVGASLLVSTNNLVSLYLSLELQSFTLYILAASQIRSFKGTSGGLKYFLLGGLSSGFILLACSLIYAYTGTLNIDYIFYMYSDSSINYILDSCLLILFAGLLFKVSAAPFHNWAPDVYSDVPTYTTTWLIVIAKVSILTFMLVLIHNINSVLNLNHLNILDEYYSFKYNFNINSDTYSLINSIFVSNDVSLNNSIEVGKNLDNINNFVYNSDLSLLNNLIPILNYYINIPISFWNSSYSSLGLWTNIIAVSALLSLIIGTLVGISQSKIKRLFAYSTIAHVGFLLLALSLNSVSGMDAFIFYLIQYTITNLNLFFILIAWGYLYSKYYLEKEFVPIRFLYINPFSWKDTYVQPTLYDYGQYIKKKLIGEKENYGSSNNYPYNNLKINTINNHLVISHDKNYYDFDDEDTEWLYTPVPFLINFKGMYYKDPFLAFCLTITLLSLAGIPPMIGFFAKQQVLLAALQTDFLFVSIVAILTSVIGAAYYLRIIKFIYFYDEVFMPHYINNNTSENNFEDYINNSIFNTLNVNNYSNNNNNVFYDNTSTEDNIPMLPSNSLSLVIAILTNISLFYILKPYIFINMINMMILPLFLN